MKGFIRNKSGILFGFAVLAITCFIWQNAIMNATASAESSGVIVDMIAPSDPVKAASWSLWVRKLAHVVEYALLGGAVFALAVQLKARYRTSVYGWAFFYVLAVAVVDEHIQSFSDRTSSTGDIVLDFMGSCLGFVSVGLAVWVYVKIKKMRNVKNTGDSSCGR